MRRDLLPLLAPPDTDVIHAAHFPLDKMPFVSVVNHARSLPVIVRLVARSLGDGSLHLLLAPFDGVRRAHPCCPHLLDSLGNEVLTGDLLIWCLRSPRGGPEERPVLARRKLRLHGIIPLLDIWLVHECRSVHAVFVGR